MTDIAPKLFKTIEDAFHKYMEENETIKRFLKNVDKGTATSEEASEYAMLVGECASNALCSVLTKENLPGGKLYWNIADRTIRPILEEAYQLVNKTAAKVLEAEDQKIGIGLKAVWGKFPEYRVKDLIDKIVEESLAEEE